MRIILAIFTDRFEVYGSLKPFFEQYPQYAELKDKIDYTMSRKITIRAFRFQITTAECSQVFKWGITAGGMVSVCLADTFTLQLP